MEAILHRAACLQRGSLPGTALDENFFCRLKQFRIIAARYDKGRNFLAVHIAAATSCLLNDKPKAVSSRHSKI